MSTFYNKIGNKTIAELPAIPTSFAGSYNVVTSATTFTWMNNNTITGCTNVVQYYNLDKSLWTDVGSVASNVDTYVYTGGTVSADDNYHVRVAAYQTGTTRYYPSAVKTAYMIKGEGGYPIDGLLSRWTFDEDDLVDEINGYDLGYLNGDEAYQDGLLERCLQRLDGGCIFSNESNIMNVFAGTNNYSIAGWYMFPSGGWSCGRTGVGDEWWDIDDNDYIGWVFEGSEDNLRVIRRNSGADNVNVTTILGGNFTAGVWYHIAQTYNGTNQITYLNGQVLDTHGNSDALSARSYFGIANYTGSDEVRIDNYYLYDRALSDVEIGYLYNGGEGD